ncbi:MAG: hypothetical protein FJX54_07385 [Alphaproteobacteria bacterium]|nr:hypothetical protein [Alphaproteobacteria bacterium]
MSTRKKTFYSCLDVASIKEVPQPLQHLANGRMAEQAGGQIVFYLTEDGYTRGTHEMVLARLQRSSNIDGVIFFRLTQFASGGGIQASVMRHLVEQGYELHFARERLTIRTIEQVEDACRKLRIHGWTERRGRMRLESRAVADASNSPESTRIDSA